MNESSVDWAGNFAVCYDLFNSQHTSFIRYWHSIWYDGIFSLQLPTSNCYCFLSLLGREAWCKILKYKIESRGISQNENFTIMQSYSISSSADTKKFITFSSNFTSDYFLQSIQQDWIRKRWKIYQVFAQFNTSPARFFCCCINFIGCKQKLQQLAETSAVFILSSW